MSERLYAAHKAGKEIQAVICVAANSDQPAVSDYAGLPLQVMRAKKVPRRGFATGLWLWSLRVRDPNGNEWVGRGKGPQLWLRPVGGSHA